MDAGTRRLVRERAGERCEYCRLPQSALPLARFHIEHVIARQHRGGDSPGNLAFPAITAIFTRDRTCPASTHRMVESAGSSIPARIAGEEHFETWGLLLLGLTSTGRITVSVLAMNSQAQLETRRAAGLGP